MVHQAAEEAAREEALAAKAKNSKPPRSGKLRRRGNGSSDSLPNVEAKGKHGAKEDSDGLGKSELGVDGASPFELKLDLANLRQTKKRAASLRVRSDSILGAELESAADLDGQREAAVAAEVSASPLGAPPAKQPSERPLFVHKRARDGQIHALSRSRQAVASATDASTEAADSVSGRP